MASDELEAGGKLGDGYLLGFRSFGLDENRLTGLTHSNFMYTPGAVEIATCEKTYTMFSVALDGVRMEHEHPVPVVGCTCGFYVYKALPLLYDKLGYQILTCLVGSFGRIVECRYGFRAEKLKLLAMVGSRPLPYCDNPEFWNNFVSKKYGLPVIKEGACVVQNHPLFSELGFFLPVYTPPPKFTDLEALLNGPW